MKHKKPGQNVRFPSTLDDEELNQIYIVIDMIFDDIKFRCIVKAKYSEMTFPFSCSVIVSDFKFCDN